MSYDDIIVSVISALGLGYSMWRLLLARPKYIRFVLNGALLRMHGLVGCESAQNSFCLVDDFLRGVPTLKENAKYQGTCFGKYPTAARLVTAFPALNYLVLQKV